jgi:hypothetical protein
MYYVLESSREPPITTSNSSLQIQPIFSVHSLLELLRIVFLSLFIYLFLKSKRYIKKTVLVLWKFQFFFHNTCKIEQMVLVRYFCCSTLYCIDQQTFHCGFTVSGNQLTAKKLPCQPIPVLEAFHFMWIIRPNSSR